MSALWSCAGLGSNLVPSLIDSGSVLPHKCLLIASDPTNPWRVSLWYSRNQTYKEEDGRAPGQCPSPTAPCNLGMGSSVIRVLPQRQKRVGIKERELRSGQPSASCVTYKTGTVDVLVLRWFAGQMTCIYEELGDCKERTL